jgi:hypothetical protein
MHAHTSVNQDAASRLATSGLVLQAKPAGTMAWTVKFLERCAYRPMTTTADREFLSRWRWQHYMEQETIKNGSMTVHDFEDGKDDLPTARTVGLYVDGTLAAAMRLHAINAEAFNIDVVDIARDRVEREIAAGKRFVYSSRWVSDPKFSNTVPFIIAATRITPLACEYHRADYALSSSRENHVKMYQRMQNAVLWSEKPEPIDNLDYLYHLIASDYHEFRDRIPVDRQAYASTKAERHEMFSPTSDGSRMITPTAPDIAAGLQVTDFAL